MARSFARLSTGHPKLAMLLMLLFCAVASGVINDTPIVALMMPILVGAALRAKTSPARTLLPMNYAVLIGGMSTAIGTSTNLLVVAIAADLGMRRFSLFDFTPMAALAALGGLLYAWLVVPRLLPERTAPLTDAAPRIYNAILHVRADGFANGKTVSEVLEKTANHMRIERIERIVRGAHLELPRMPTVALQEDDRLFVSDTPENLKEFETLLGATLHNVANPDKPIDEASPLAAPDQQLAEVVVTENSLLHMNTLRRARFADFFHVLILGLHGGRHHGDVDIGDAVLKVGDVLLVQGSAEAIQALRSNTGLLVLAEATDLPTTSRAPLALGIIAAAVLAAAFKLLPISVAALIGVLLMILTRCLAWKDIGASLSTKVVMLVAASLALGAALTHTGGTDYIAKLFLAGTHGISPELQIGMLMLLMALLTNFVSNNAAAAIGTPIAFDIARNLGVSPEPFVLAILFGANFCFATPMAYQTNLMVMSAGGYRFADFLRAGVPLTALMLAIYTVLLPRFFPF